MKKDLTNIHNNFFLHLLSKKENAIDFLRISIPKEIFDQIDFDFLDFDMQSHVLPNLKSTMKDLVIKTKLKNKKELDFYLLVEHKSSIDNSKPKDVFIQIFKYIFNIIFEDYKNKKELRLVIPLVFFSLFPRHCEYSKQSLILWIASSTRNDKIVFKKRIFSLI